MPPKKESSKGTASDKTGAKSPENEPIGNTADIEISVEGFENLKGKYRVTDVLVQAEYMGTVIGESPQQPITNDDYIIHYFKCVLRYYDNNEQCVNDLINNPLVFNVFQTEGVYDLSNLHKEDEPVEEETLPVVETKEKKIAVEKKDAKAPPSSKSGKSGKGEKAPPPGPPPPEIVGRCSIDLLPLVLGESHIRDTLIIEQDSIVTDDNMIPRDQLPRIRVHLHMPEPILDDYVIKSSNILQVGVESIYNMPEEDILPKKFYYTFGTRLPRNDTEPDGLEPLLLFDGIVTDQKDDKTIKWWPYLTGLQNRASYMNESFDKNIFSLKNELNIDLKKTFAKYTNDDEVIEGLERPYRIEWNIMKRFWLRPQDSTTLSTRIKKFRKIPFELHGKKDPVERVNFIVDPSAEIPQVTPTPIEEPPPLSSADKHYMGFLDLSKLLCTGNVKTRVMSQLSTFVAPEIEAVTGMKEVIFKEAVAPPATSKKGSPPPKKDKSGGKGSPPSGKESPPPTAETIEPEKPVLIQVPETGEPTFIVVEFNLLRPFEEKRPLDDLTKSIRNIVPERPALPREIVQIQNVDKDFESCITEMISQMYKQYYNYLEVKNAPCRPHYFLGIDDEQDFGQFLIETGVYTIFKKGLKKCIYQIVDKKFPADVDLRSTPNFDRYINEVYTYITKRTNTIINTALPLDIKMTKTKEEKCFSQTYRDLLLYAKEAEENNDLETARRYYLERITYQENNAEYWLDYAIFEIGQNDLSKAYQYCKECLSIDFHHKFGMLVLSLIMIMKKNFQIAEEILLTLIEIHPDFIHGLVVIYIFYLFRERLSHADVMYENMQKCFNQIEQSQVLEHFEQVKELTWDNHLWKSNQIFARTTALLLKLKCCQFAELALAQELTHSTDKLSYHYYRAVNYYLTRQYSLAIETLDKALRIQGPDIAVGGLLAHCYYKTNAFADALEYFEPLLYTYKRPDDIILIYARLSEILKIRQKYKKALEVILLACKYTPTPNVWLQAGLIEKDLENYESAEMCLTEANILDNKLKKVWAALSEVNKLMHNESEALICSHLSEDVYFMDTSEPQKIAYATDVGKCAK